MTETNKNKSGDGDKNLYENDLERQWSNSSSIQGISPDLMDVRRSDSLNDAPVADPASFSPWLIPYAAIMAGPLIAGLLTLLADGEPPRVRQALVVFSTAATAWVISLGLTVTESVIFSPGVDAGIRLGVLLVSGFVLWALYTFWMGGKQTLDQDSLKHSAVAVVAISAMFWLGKDTTWLLWLGR